MDTTEDTIVTVECTNTPPAVIECPIEKEVLIEVYKGSTGDTGPQGPAGQSLKYGTFLEFPNIGDDLYIYIDTKANMIYRWDPDELRYRCIGTDYRDIKNIDGGSANE